METIFLTRVELAKLTGLSTQLIYYYIKKKKKNPLPVGGGSQQLIDVRDFCIWKWGQTYGLIKFNEYIEKHEGKK